MDQLQLGQLDLWIIGLYFVLIFGVAIWASRQERTNSQDYFLAGKNLGWFVIGASLFASNIGSEHLVGLAGAGASSGVAVAQFEILASFILLLLGWVFVPFYLKSGVATMPEFLERRYGSPARMYLSFVSVVAYVLTKISVTIYAGGMIFQAMGMSFWVGAMAIVLATGIYTVFGGLRAVIYTDMVQMFIMVGGSLLVSYFGIMKLGGIEELTTYVPHRFWTLWRESSDPAFPWTGILFGAPILGVWYWCTDQFIVQRVLSARDQTQARRGTIFGGFLKLLPLFIFVLPGIICFALASRGDFVLTHPDHALATLVAVVMPTGLKGLVIAGLFAALMSSLSSVFNSCSTLITYDFYKRFKPEASEKHLIWVGQISTIILVGAGLLWIPFMKYISGQLFQYLQSVQAYISPPIAAVFLLGLFIKRLNLAGAMASLFTGLFAGGLRLILELNAPSLSGLALSYARLNFLHFAFFLFVVCSAVLIIVSLMTAAPPAEKLKDVTYTKDGPFLKTLQEKRDMLLSVLLVFCIFVIWWVFS